MTTIRNFCCDDLLRFSSVNLDHLTITESIRTYFSWLAQWPDYFNVAVTPRKRIMAYIVAAAVKGGEAEEDQGSLGGVQDKGEGWFGQITTVSVHSEYRRRGLGTKLMRMFESQLLDKMYFFPGDLSYSIRCYVGVNNKPARIFFGKFGFQEHRCQSKFISKKEDAVDMRKVLVDGGDFELSRLSTSKEIKPNRDILGLVVQKLCHTDVFSFGQVSKRWKMALLENMRYFPLGRFPGVLAPGETRETHRLFELNHLSGYFEEIANLAIPHTFICSGSAFGWLFLMDDNLETKLYNPFCRKEVNLPSLQTIPNSVDFQMNKAVYSSNPSFPPNPFIVIVYEAGSSQLAFCQPGDHRWTILDCHCNGNCYTDCIYWNAKFYALRAFGQILAFSIQCNGHGNYSVCKDIIAPPLHGNIPVFHMYLVEVNGALVRVSREIEVAQEQENPDRSKPEFPEDDGTADITDDDDETDYDDETDNTVITDDDETDNSVITDDDETDNSVITDDDETHNSDDTFDDEIYSKHWKQLVVGFRMQIFDDIEQEWVNLETLGDYSIFVGRNTSFSLRAADFPGCIPNAVYFGGSTGYEMGIYSFNNQTMNRNITNPPLNDSAAPFLPLWIDHTLWSLLADG